MVAQFRAGAAGHGKIWAIPGGRRTLVVLEGDIDATRKAELDRAVEEVLAAGAQVQVDACGLTFLDSVGVAALARMAIRTPGPMIIFGASEAVQFLLELTALSDMVELWPDDPTAPGPLRARRQQE